ncbi:hypothetical protein OG21DRAFT_1447278 [Imleria badia]|nr:hypothetical protein OG21DRAFT_1447278 [Imleria badia]
MDGTTNQAVRHPMYYFPHGTHIFRVENMLYKLHNDFLATHSGLFNDMFVIGDTNSSPIEGRSDAQPIVLEGEEQAIFDLFLDHVHGRSRSVGADAAYTHEQLRGLLKFTDKYRCLMTRNFVIDHIWDQRFSYRPAELVQLGCWFSIPKFFHRGFKSLLAMPLKEINREHRLEMGQEVFIALVYAKSALDEHMRLVACEEPVILTHVTDCQDPSACQEDWHNVWWNGMGRFLLDGRNPQPFSDAVERFREMQFGRMSQGCRNLMFQLLDRGTGFRRADLFITEICNGLIQDFLVLDVN